MYYQIFFFKVYFLYFCHIILFMVMSFWVTLLLYIHKRVGFSFVCSNSCSKLNFWFSTCNWIVLLLLFCHFLMFSLQKIYLNFISSKVKAQRILTCWRECKYLTSFVESRWQPPRTHGALEGFHFGGVYLRSTFSGL